MKRLIKRLKPRVSWNREGWLPGYQADRRRAIKGRAGVPSLEALEERTVLSTFTVRPSWSVPPNPPPSPPQPIAANSVTPINPTCQVGDCVAHAISGFAVPLNEEGRAGR